MDVNKKISIKLGKKTIEIKLWWIIAGAALLLAAVLAIVLLLSCGDEKKPEEPPSASVDTASSEEVLSELGSAAESEESEVTPSTDVSESSEESTPSEECSEGSSEDSLSEEPSSEEQESSGAESETSAEEEPSFAESENSSAESQTPPVESEVPPVESEAPPVESEVPPVESEAPPVESEAPPVESEAPPVESEAPPVESEAPPVESEAPPVESEAPPVESEAPPVESEAPPVESEAPPVESEAPPVESEAPPVESEAPPVESEAPPVESEAPPVESEAPPVESETPPIESQPPIEESSEDESSVIIDMDAPMNPLPDTLMTDPVDSYFNDSVFVGYSIMMHFGRYIGEWHSEIDASIMGNPLFYAGVGVSFYRDRVYPSGLPLYQGNTYSFSELPTATGRNTIYIGLMGYSDVRRFGVDGGYVETISGIQRILSANPNVNLVILACTYNTGEYSDSLPYSVNNGNILRYNNMVLDYCTSIGIDFVDVATPQTTYNGYLPMEYSSDEEYHIAKKAFYLWVDVLRDYAKKKQAGTWQNMTDMPSLPAFA